MIGAMLCLLFVLGISLIVYLKSTRLYGYFRERGFPEENGSFPFGSGMFWDHYLKGVPLRNYPSLFRRKYPTERFFISWHFHMPWIFVLEKNLSNRILNEDTHVFRDPSSGPFHMEKWERRFCGLLLKHEESKLKELIQLTQQHWSLRDLLGDLYKAGDDLIDHLSRINLLTETRSVLSKYILEGIVRLSLGVSGDCFIRKSEIFHLFRRLKGNKGRILNNGWIPQSVLNWIPLSSNDVLTVKSFDLLLSHCSRLREQILRETNPSVSASLSSYVIIGLLLDFKATNAFLKRALEVLALFPRIQEELRAEIVELLYKNKTIYQKRNKTLQTCLDPEEFMQCRALKDFVCALAIRSRPFLYKRVNFRTYRIPGTLLDIPKGSFFVFPQDAFEDKAAEVNGHFESLKTGSRTNSLGKEFTLLMLQVLIIRLLPTYKIVTSRRIKARRSSSPLNSKMRPWIQFERI